MAAGAPLALCTTGWERHETVLNRSVDCVHISDFIDVKGSCIWCATQRKIGKPCAREW